jgi:hypothetical protein
MGENPQDTGWTPAERALAGLAALLIVAIVALVAVVLPSMSGDPAAAAASPAPDDIASTPAAASASDAAPRRTPVPLPTVGPASAGDPLAGVTSYRFDVSLEGSGRSSPLTPIDGVIRVTGMVITAPREAMEFVLTGHQADTTMTVRMIGDRAWVDYGGGFIAVEQEELPSIRESFESYRPENLFSQFIGELPPDAELVGEVRVAGRAAREYRISPTIMPVPGIATGVRFSAVIAMDDELGIPLAMSSEFTHADEAMDGFFRIEMKLHGLNDPENTLTRPDLPST